METTGNYVVDVLDSEGRLTQVTVRAQTQVEADAKAARMGYKVLCTDAKMKNLFNPL